MPLGKDRQIRCCRLLIKKLYQTYRCVCEVMSASTEHTEARALAREMLNDWDAIFQGFGAATFTADQ